MYLWCHIQPASMDTMLNSFYVHVETVHVPLCNSHDHDHSHYLPYFYDNRGLLHLAESRPLTTLINKLEQATRKSTSYPRLNGTPFVTGPTEVGAAWYENVWTKRLGNSLPYYKANQWETTVAVESSFEEIQQQCSTVPLIPSNCKDHYYFHGVPDILLQRKRASDSPEDNSIESAIIASTHNDEEDTEESDCSTTFIENKNVPQPVCQIQGCIVPKKMSQLMSALHFLLASKAMKKACLRDNWEGIIVV